MPTPGQIQEVAKHFVIAAIWADAPDGSNPRATIKTQARAFDLCKSFIDKNHNLFTSAMNCSSRGYGSHPDAGSAEAAFGHDLWLTSQGHGTGFWDRNELDVGCQLTVACKAFAWPSYCFSRGWFYL